MKQVLDLIMEIADTMVDRYGNPDGKFKPWPRPGSSINRELSLLQRSFMLGYESQPRKVARPLRFHRLAESSPGRDSSSKKTMTRCPRIAPIVHERNVSSGLLLRIQKRGIA